MNKQSFFSVLVFIGIMLSACQQKKGDNSITTDMVKNPNTASGTTSAKLAEISFEQTSWDWGTSPKGKEIVHYFEFTNSGKNKLIIGNASASCGCTVPSWPKEPISPGETGKIKVVYNGSGSGKVDKTITITANTNPNITKLHIGGIIESETTK